MSRQCVKPEPRRTFVLRTVPRQPAPAWSVVQVWPAGVGVDLAWFWDERLAREYLYFKQRQRVS